MKVRCLLGMVLMSWLLVASAIADEAPVPGGSTRRAWWGPISENRLVFAAAGIRESDPGSGRITSLSLMGGFWEEYQHPSPPHGSSGRLEVWLSYGTGDQQAISRLGTNVGLMCPPWGPVRVSGHVRGGLEHRSDDPKAGLGGFVGLGVDFGIWVHPEWQIGLQGNLNLGISTKSWNDFAFGIRYSPRRLSKIVNP
jgi:hypothetical protein